MEKHRCPGCMGLTENAVCERCGWPMGKDNEVHQLPVGTRLRDQYIIGKALGQGGFGITYLGWDDYLDMPVAIKEFYPNAMVTRECTVGVTVHCTSDQVLPNYNISKERFLREAKALARLRDVPGVVGVHGFFEENGTAYIIMEYVKGTDLATYVARKGGRLTPEETFRILRPVMEALDMVHQAELVHRDISPDNIMLHPRGGAKLLDFGAVRNVEGAEAGKDMAQSTEAILKHGFAPAEQYKSRGGLGPWTDEYAMCATVYYCLTGQIPPQAVERMLEDIEVDFNIPGLPQYQREALTKGMAIRAKDRHGSMRKLLEALFPAEVPGQAAAPVTVEPVRAAAVTEHAPVPEVKVAEPAGMPADRPDIAPVQVMAEPAPVERTKVQKKKAKGVGEFLIPVAVLLILTAVVLSLLPRGWREENGVYHYFRYGHQVTGWQTINGKQYRFDDEGAMLTDWQVIDGCSYYFGPDGVMRTGWQTIYDWSFYFSEDGVMCIGWQEIDGDTYYFGPDGTMRTGWQWVDGDRYHFGEDGIMRTGWQMIDGNRYYFGEDGIMVTGWQMIGDDKYYFGEDGLMRTGQQRIDGMLYCFDHSGALDVEPVYLNELEILQYQGKMWTRSEKSPSGPYDTKQDADWSDLDTPGHTAGTVRDNQGNVYTYGISVDGADVMTYYIEFYLGGKYTRFTGTCACPERDAAVSSKVYNEKSMWEKYFTVYLDGQYVGMSPVMRFDHAPEYFEFDVTGVEVLRIEYPSTKGPSEIATIFDGMLS